MKFTSLDEQGKRVTVEVLWGDHRYGCQQCQHVVIDAPATLAYSCAIGAPLLAEELAKRQAPVSREKTAGVKEWAKKTGGFSEFDRAKPEYVRQITRYVEAK